MDTYKPVMSFGDDVAESYDELARRGDEAATVAFLEQLARGGPALELAIGTGRIALPLGLVKKQVPDLRDRLVPSSGRLSADGWCSSRSDRLCAVQC